MIQDCFKPELHDQPCDCRQRLKRVAPIPGPRVAFVKVSGRHIHTDADPCPHTEAQWLAGECDCIFLPGFPQVVS